MKVSIIIPAHNEEKRINVILEEYPKFFNKIKRDGKLDFEILVVLNACKDNTLEIVKKAKKNHKKIKFLNFEQAGKGFAITEGFKDALKRKIELIGFVDADMATPPKAFYELVEKIDKYDGIIASRWKKGAIIKTKQTLMRIITSRGFNFITRALLLLSFSDTQCGAKLFKSKVLKDFVEKKNTAEWAFDVDLLYYSKIKGFKIKEIPTIWQDKKGSKLSIIKVPFQMFSSVLRIRLIHSPFKFIVRLYEKLPENKKIHNW